MTKPKWVNPTRQAHLVSLFVRSRGFCIYGEQNCIIPEHHYEVFIESLINGWKADDRETNRLEWKNERKIMHALNEKTLPMRGRFNGVSSDIWHDSQPIYYLESMGMDCLKLKPFAKVKLSSSYQHLYVDLGDSLRNVSKNRKRKAIRYNKPLPQSANDIVSKLIIEAVKDYLNY
jgi:hypothetical protein